MASNKHYRYDLLISCADTDYAWVQGYLVPALGLPGERITTPQDFHPGAPIVTEFERAVAESRYTVLILSSAFLADIWPMFSEKLVSYASVAEQRNRLIPLLLQPSPLPTRIKFLVPLDCTDEANWQESVARLRALLDLSEPGPKRIPCPYPGLRPFSSDNNAGHFYGRETEITHLLQHLRHHSIFFIVGPSGSGKSSLVSAGLLRRLPETSFFPKDFWLVREIRPGSKPLESLAQALDGNLAQPAQTITNLLAKHSPTERLLLVIDQFEDIFTQAERDEQRRFIAVLQELHPLKSCTLLIVLRADFYPDLMICDLWPIDPSQRLEIAPLRGEALRQAIQQPAMDVRVYLESGLLERLLADAANEPGVLPLIQETMTLLWGEIQHRLIPLRVYERLGRDGRSGLAAAMAIKADAALAELSPGQRSIARRIFLRLVQFGEGRADTRRQQSVEALRAAGDESTLFDWILLHLADHRLLTLSSGEGKNGRQVDISHEALIEGWPTLQGWLSERREAEQTRRRLETKAAEWVRLGRGQGGLLDEVLLPEAERWLASPDAADLGFDEDLQALVQASRKAIEELNKAKQIATIGTVAAALMHRINNTLNIILPNISRLRRRVDSSDKTIWEILDIIERNTRYTSEFIMRFQEPLKETELQMVDVNTCLQEAESQVRQDHQHKVEFETIEIIYNLDNSLPLVKASPSQLTEILCNLISNSYQAMGPEGGTLTIFSRCDDDLIEVEIRDTGPGIPPEIRDKLFLKPVPSRKPGGTVGSGLGLWISALLLQWYNGEIQIGKTGPYGTSVLVRLPF